MKINMNFAGLVVTLTHQEVDDLYNTTDPIALFNKIKALVESAKAALVAAQSLGGAVAAAAGAVLAILKNPVITLVIALLVAYIMAERELMRLVDKGNGVYLTLPWPAIFNPLGAVLWWLIIPTTVPPSVPLTVRRSTGTDFSPNEDWTQEPY